MEFYKRKFMAFVFAFAFIFIFALGCAPSVPPKDSSISQTEEFDGLSVHYLDVGQGDSILICFPDKTNMLIDCGNGSALAVDNILTALDAKEITSLDYLVLTHPDSDHIGGVEKVFETIKVKRVYHPDIIEGKLGFDEYFDTLAFLKNKGAELKISLMGECFGEDYKLAFLSQMSRNENGSPYREFIWAEAPTEKQINDLSPYIYLEYKSVRFLFTGDCSDGQEAALMQNYKVQVLNNLFSTKGLKVKLEDIDFLKVAHHGSDDSSSWEFLSLLNPKHAVISVGGDNTYGHPASSVLKRFEYINPNFKLYRTDTNGAVSVFIDKEGNLAVKTANTIK